MKKEYLNEICHIAHELRTPVSAILGFSESLLLDEHTKEQEEALKIIQHCCFNMAKIIDDLLDFSKLGAGKFSLEEKKFAFYEFMNKTMETNRIGIESKGLSFRVDVSHEIPEYVIGDELRLGQILNNLLSNAAKFTKEGEVSVSVEKIKETKEEIELLFRISDTGIGITEEGKEKLFETFFQAHASIDGSFNGTGLGLCVVNELVNLMNGSITVDSQKGKGSCFSFTVKLKRAKEVKGLLEEILSCIEGEDWERAETLSCQLKELVSEENKELYQGVFRLLLTVRKADKQKALYHYTETKNRILTLL